MKSDYDSSEGKGMEIVLTDELRHQRIQKGKQEISRRKAA
jgi:hypothetical protein